MKAQRQKFCDEQNFVLHWHSARNFEPTPKILALGVGAGEGASHPQHLPVILTTLRRECAEWRSNVESEAPAGRSGRTAQFHQGTMVRLLLHVQLLCLT